MTFESGKCPGEPCDLHNLHTPKVQIGNDSLHDLVFGHTHKARDWKAVKIGYDKWVRIVNVGCSLPSGHIEEYAKLNMNGWSWCVHSVARLVRV